MNFGFEVFLGKSLRDGVLVDDTLEDFHEEDYVLDEGCDEHMED